MLENEKDLLGLISQKDDGINNIIKLLFIEYKNKRLQNKLYSKDDYIPQNLIKIYYKVNGHLDFKTIVDNFKRKYICSENELENVKKKDERNGLEMVYNYIQSDEWKKFDNIYIICKLHQLLYSQVPYNSYGGNFRKSSSFVTAGGDFTEEYNNISNQISKLYNQYLEIAKFSEEVETTKDMNKLIQYIDKCLELKCQIIRIHPFSDGNGRTSRALLNIFFRRVNLPPTYVKLEEKQEYLDAMDKAIRLNDYVSIKKFYYYKICDSIVELDINERIKKEPKSK